MNSQLIANFFESKEVLREHDKNVNQFDVLSIFKEQIGETVWSKFFAFLLDSNERHGFGLDFFKNWVIEIQNFNDPNTEILSKFDLKSVKRVKSFTEWPTPKGRFVDIVLELMDGNGTIIGVIGIENKVLAIEQLEQVKDYQDALIEIFKGELQRCLIFLTLTARESLTKASDGNCPTIEIGFKSIENIISLVKTDKDSPQELYLKLVESYLDKLMGQHEGNTNISEILLELYKDADNRKVMKWIARYMPGTHLLTAGLESKIRPYASEKFKKEMDDKWLFHTYPQDPDSNPMEFKFHVMTIKDFDLEMSLCYVLRCNDKNPEIGSEFTLLLALYIDKKHGDIDSKIKSQIRAKYQLKHNTTSNWSRWVNLYTGQSCKLEDLGNGDIENLFGIFKDRVDKILKSIRDNCKAHSK